MISQTPGMGELQISSGGRRNVEETLATFVVSFSKPFLPKMGYSQPSKILTFCIFYISVFVNTTAMIVNSYAILYMCMEVIIGHSDRSPQRVMISQTLSIWEPQISSGGRRNVGKTLPRFGSEFCKILPSQNRILWTFQNCGILNFHISLFVNTTAMVVSYCTKLGPVDLSSDVLLFQNGIFLTFQNCGISHLSHFYICQYYS